MYLAMNTTYMIILFFITFVATVISTYFIRNVLIDAAISDSPIVSEHRHKTGTPTMGGIAFLFAILFVMSLFYNNTTILIASFIMMTGGVMGLIDDLLGLKVKEYQKVVKNVINDVVPIGILDLGPGEEARITTEKAKAQLEPLLASGKIEQVAEIPIKYEPHESVKIIAQLLPGLFLVLTSTVWTLGGFNLGLLAIPIIIIAVLGCINAVNLIDGMDGLAAGIIAISSFACGIFCYINGNMEGIAPFAILLAICLGFLVFNKYPAKIFMGDTGSFILGAGFAAAVLITNIPYFGVLALAVPIGSTIISLMHRAHIITLPVEPLHHALNYQGISEVKIVLSYWALTAIACAIGLIIDFLIYL
jgi:phospho-N-acetylmuramoyl-pentapeptide-transferase